MIKKFGSDITINVIASAIASVIFLAAGFFWGQYQERQHYGKNSIDYEMFSYRWSRIHRLACCRQGIPERVDENTT